MAAKKKRANWTKQQPGDESDLTTCIERIRRPRAKRTHGTKGVKR